MAFSHPVSQVRCFTQGYVQAQPDPRDDAKYETKSDPHQINPIALHGFSWRSWFSRSGVGANIGTAEYLRMFEKSPTGLQ